MHRVPVWVALLLVCAAVGATYLITEKTVSSRYDALIEVRSIARRVKFLCRRNR